MLHTRYCFPVGSELPGPVVALEMASLLQWLLCHIFTYYYILFYFCTLYLIVFFGAGGPFSQPYVWGLSVSSLLRHGLTAVKATSIYLSINLA